MCTGTASTTASQGVAIQESCLSIPTLLVSQQTIYTIYEKDQYGQKLDTGVSYMSEYDCYKRELKTEGGFESLFTCDEIV